MLRDLDAKEDARDRIDDSINKLRSQIAGLQAKINEMMPARNKLQREINELENKLDGPDDKPPPLTEQERKDLQLRNSIAMTFRS